MKVSGDSREVARAAILLSMTASREEEAALKEKLLAQEIHGVAADYGGEFVQSVMKIVERAVVAAKREHVIGGAVPGNHQGTGAERGRKNRRSPPGRACGCGRFLWHRPGSPERGVHRHGPPCHLIASQRKKG